MPALAAAYVVAYEYQFVPYATIAHWRESHALALEQLQARQAGGSAWFTLERGGIRLADYVGVVQVSGFTLEILPKTDDARRTGQETAGEQEGQQDRWRRVLLGMLHHVLNLPLTVPGPAALATAPHRMLDVFLAAFVAQAEAVFRTGLVKHYHPAEGNQTALRGQLLFGQHLNHNLLHKERFFTRHQVYDRAHPFNCWLRMALQVAADQAHGASLAAHARTLLLHWPELPTVRFPEAPPALTRKTAHYGPALQLALLVLRALSPALQRGQRQALALLFNMSSLFEEYVEKLLRRAAAQSSCLVQAQPEKLFWSKIRVRPDVVVTVLPTLEDPQSARVCVLDMKWKVPKAGKPSPEDMRQVYAYCHLWGARHGVLVYPWSGPLQQPRRGTYAASKWAVAGATITGHTLYAQIFSLNGSLNTNFGRQLLQEVRNLMSGT